MSAEQIAEGERLAEAWQSSQRTDKE